MPWSDSYFLSRFRSQDSEGKKRKKKDREEQRKASRRVRGTGIRQGGGKKRKKRRVVAAAVCGRTEVTFLFPLPRLTFFLPTHLGTLLPWRSSCTAVGVG